MKRRILLADDSVTIQKVIELTFMDEDYEVRAVSNGDEAVALLSEMNPDFVIADVHMPGADSFLKKPFDSQELLQRVDELIAAKGPGLAQPAAVPPAPPAPEPAWAA